MCKARSPPRTKSKALRLKSKLQAFFTEQSITKLETDRFRLSLHKNSGKAPLIVPEEWEREPVSAPEAFHRYAIQLNKEDIRGALEAGDEVQGCRIVSAAHSYGLSKEK